MSTEPSLSRGPAVPIRDARALRHQVDTAMTETPVTDMHTHLFAPEFGTLGLWGIDELLTYHYLIAELFRFSPVTPDRFWAMGKPQQADLIWETLFVRHTPLSEAARGVVTVLSALGLDPGAPDLSEARAYFRSQSLDTYLRRVLDLTRVRELVMTNDPFDDQEAPVWEGGVRWDARFHAALRLDPLLNDWPEAVPKLSARGYAVREDFAGDTAGQMRRFLDGWIARMRPLYAAVSLPDTFQFPEDSARGRMLRDAVLPTCGEHRLPFALMIGVRRRVNPALRQAGDGLGRADLQAVERLCAGWSGLRFLVSVLSRENQHELCVLARKFGNLLPFGCWWFMNNPSIVSEITRERLEMLGSSFVAQHSDARVLDQLLYKWRQSRRLVADALYEAYRPLLEDGRPVTPADVARDAERLLSGNFRAWVGLDAAAGATHPR